MSDRTPAVLPARLASEVEVFIDSQTERATKYDNAEILDESSTYDLHTLAARMYAAGYEEGARAASERDRGVRRREREAQRRQAKTDKP